MLIHRPRCLRALWEYFLLSAAIMSNVILAVCGEASSSSNGIKNTAAAAESELNKIYNMSKLAHTIDCESENNRVREKVSYVICVRGRDSETWGDEWVDNITLLQQAAHGRGWRSGSISQHRYQWASVPMTMSYRRCRNGQMFTTCSRSIRAHVSTAMPAPSPLDTTTR